MKALAVMKRDLRKYQRNPVTVITSILMPLVYLLILGNAFQGKLKNLPLAIVSQDQGVYGRRMMEELQALAVGPKTVHLVFVNDPGEAVDGVRDGKFKAALIVPPEFSHRINQGRVGELGLFTDNVDSVAAAALEGSVQQAMAALKIPYETARPLKLNGAVLRPSGLFTTVDYDQSLIPGVIVMSLFMGSLTSGVFNWVMDKFMGVTECYLVTPLSRWDIAIGMLGGGVLVTSLAATLVLFLGLLMTGGRIAGGFPALLTIIAIIVISGTGLLAMMFSILGRAGHPRLVGVLSGFLNVILFFPSGAIYPIESFPRWLRAFAVFNPETHAVSALKSILFKGANFAAVRGDMAFLLVFMILMLFTASVSFKRTL
jgi:ABC-2 type transport system permease protein